MKNILLRRNFLFLIFFPFIILSCAVSPSPLSPASRAALESVGGFEKAALLESVVPSWLPFAEEITPGLSYFSGKIAEPPLEFYALRIELGEPSLRIKVGAGTPPDAEVPGSAKTLASANKSGHVYSTFVSGFVRRNGLLAGINATPFDPVSGKEGEDRIIRGVSIADGQVLAAPNKRFDALVFYPGKAAVVEQREMGDLEGIENAVGGFHAILLNGELTERTAETQAQVRYARSAAGISSTGTGLYLLAIDGRRAASRGATEAETAVLLRALGCDDGINLDGGGSSALALLYPDGIVRTVNKPAHNAIPGRERGVASCLGIIQVPNTGTAAEN
jgi:hypothetical protein